MKSLYVMYLTLPDEVFQEFNKNTYKQYERIHLFEKQPNESWVSLWAYDKSYRKLSKYASRFNPKYTRIQEFEFDSSEELQTELHKRKTNLFGKLSKKNFQYMKPDAEYPSTTALRVSQHERQFINDIAETPYAIFDYADDGLDPFVIDPSLFNSEIQLALDLLGFNTFKCLLGMTDDEELMELAATNYSYQVSLEGQPLDMQVLTLDLYLSCFRNILST